MKTNLFIICVLLVITQACQPDERELKDLAIELPSTPFEYEGSFNNNVPTLGRVLFYDKQLSLNGSVSCGSCHKQALAFADDVAFSVGFENELTARNSMPIQNLRSPATNTVSALFWDGREQFLPVMVMRPIANHVEMGIDDLDDLTERLSVIPYYRELFTNAYGSSEITTDKIGTALSEFVSSISSRKTKFDQAMNFGGQLTALETEGQQLFFEKYDCNSCHQVTDPNGYEMAGTFSNIGLEEVDTDKGLGAVTRLASDNGRFKIPSLRNVELTAPYMHDGRFETLEEVIDHYSDDIQPNQNLDFRLREDGQGQPVQFNISEDENKAIVAFMKTLTDYDMITNPKFSNPFKVK
jgi:cytochrome c peroxidase